MGKNTINGKEINEMMDLYNFIKENQTSDTKDVILQVPVGAVLAQDVKEITHLLKLKNIDFNFKII